LNHGVAEVSNAELAELMLGFGSAQYNPTQRVTLAAVVEALTPGLEPADTVRVF
jgi:hypothetical protein